MVKTNVRLSAPGAAQHPLAQRFEAIRTRLGVVADFPAEALREAEAAAQAWSRDGRADRTELPFVTLDPVGSMDLDQAIFLERSGTGFRVRYAIADVPSFVAPGGALDVETRRRGVTIYCPDRRVPLHPQVLSEAGASLLPGVERPAFIWDLALDASGVVTSVELERAVVRSAARLDYDSAQRDLDAGHPHEQIALLRDIGTLRVAQEAARGGASLPMPEQEVHGDEASGYTLQFRPPVATEEWNAQISLMTGMAAADAMIAARLGVLRTMPAAGVDAQERLRRQAKALGVTWPHEQPYGAFLRSLDRTDPRHLAVIHQATRLFRGAAYTAFDGAVPQERTHAAVAAPYAHVTAPLRRLVDRFGLELCYAVLNARAVPEWVRAGLALLPEQMAGGDHLASSVDRACVDTVEAAVLSDQVGQTFDVAVVEAVREGLLVQVTDPAILAQADGSARIGAVAPARLVSADVEAGTVRFRMNPRPAPGPGGV